MTATLQNVFKRNDPQVQEDAKTLDIDAFKRKYASSAKEAVLNATWKDARKKTQQVEKTDEANDLPKQPAVIKETKTELSDKSVLTNQTLENGTHVASIDNEPNNGGTITNLEEGAKAKKGGGGGVGKKEKKEKAAPAEKPATAAVVNTGDRKTRAVRLRELIADGKDKAASKEILVAEGYDVATIHSEWNRLTKK